MRTFILLSAIPGSGKSTWANQYVEAHPEAKIVSSDEIRLRNYGRVDDFHHEKEVWQTFLDDIHRYGAEENATVIADSTNITNHYRKYYANEAREFDRKVLVCFDIPYAIVLQQNQRREKDRIVPEPVMERMRREYEAPDEATLSCFTEFVRVGPSFVSPDLKTDQ